MKREARILPLDAAIGTSAGGKAAGLAHLLSIGFDVPAGFVIVDAESGRLPENLLDHWRALGGGRVAVRSSALGEDGGESSFAGQYETVLGVEGADELIHAVEDCLISMAGSRAEVYRERRLSKDAPAAMCVVVQRMVEARSAGVCFTADPLTSRRDLLVVDSVSGLGESLVSGREDADHSVFERGPGRWRETETPSSSPVLAPSDLEEIARLAIVAEAELGRPLDLEWAIDASDALYWLQARPITTLGEDPRELDTPLLRHDDVITRCNVGEMMPGAISPLTFSTCARGIDVGWQDNSIALGVAKERTAEQTYVPMFFGHLFINLSEGARFSARVTGADVDQQSLAICGRLVPQVVSPPAAPWRERLPRIARQLSQTFGIRLNLSRLEELSRGAILLGEDSAATWRAIDDSMEELYEAYARHLQVSTGAGAMAPILLGLLASGPEPSQEDHAEVAALLAGAEDVESADIVAGLERIADRILLEPAVRERFEGDPPELLRDWLESPEADEIGAAYREYLDRHGHRSVRELDVRQPEWAEDPLPIVRSLVQQIQGRGARSPGPRRATPNPGASRPRRRGVGARVARALIPWAHRAVRNRERAKSLLVATTVRFKRAYRGLAAQLVAEGRLPDPDALFFLLHEELGRLASGEELAQKAVGRREVLAFHETLDFPDVCQGQPHPERSPKDSEVENSKRILGKPVSRGQVEGRARVVNSLEDARAIEAGEILVARITDVGWTPFFGVISALVTDLGSAVSHGAVVAREYGLPAVLNTRIGTRVLRTGDWLRVDGDRGLVEILETAATPDPSSLQGGDSR